jgi:hypothetical protein
VTASDGIMGRIFIFLPRYYSYQANMKHQLVAVGRVHTLGGFDRDCLRPVDILGIPLPAACMCVQ